MICIAIVEDEPAASKTLKSMIKISERKMRRLRTSTWPSFRRRRKDGEQRIGRHTYGKKLAVRTEQYHLYVCGVRQRFGVYGRNGHLFAFR